MLEKKIKEVIIQRLNLSIEADEISNDAAIFNTGEESQENSSGHGFDLDSIDALEVVVALNKEFKVKITDREMNIFKSVNTIAEFLKNNSPAVPV